jgi:hypothetical protein
MLPAVRPYCRVPNFDGAGFCDRFIEGSAVTSGPASCTAAPDASTQPSAGKPGVGRKARGRTTGLTPAAQRHERVDAGRVAVAPRHSQPVAADEMSISDRKARRLTTGPPCLLATVAGRATCRARARPAQLFEVEPAHLAVIEGHLNVGVTVDGDRGDVDRRLLAHTQSLVLAGSSSSTALGGHRQIPERLGPSQNDSPCSASDVLLVAGMVGQGRDEPLG